MKVINLVGASGCGKSTIAKQLDGNVIQSYTTRLPRYMGEPGHIFIENINPIDDLVEIIHYPDIMTQTQRIETIYNSDIVAYAKLYGEHYFATLEQFQELQNNIYVVDPIGAEQVIKYFSDLNIPVITIYIQVDEIIRYERLKNREHKLNPTELELEVLNRLEADRRDFNVVACNYVVDGNGSIDEVIERVRKLI